MIPVDRATSSLASLIAERAECPALVEDTIMRRVLSWSFLTLFSSICGVLRGLYLVTPSGSIVLPFPPATGWLILPSLLLLKVVRVPLHFLDDVFRLNLAFESAYHIFVRWCPNLQIRTLPFVPFRGRVL